MDPSIHARSESAILEQALAWSQANEAVVLATVAHTWGSSPRPVGALMALTASGRFLGSVSGGCIEEELVARVHNSFPEAFEIIEYASDTHRSLPCGGRLLLSLEPIETIYDLPGLINTLDAGGSVKRILDLNRRTNSWTPTVPGDRTERKDNLLHVVYQPAWQLLVAGAGELAQWVCRFAQLLDYRVALCDPRQDYAEAWPITGIKVDRSYPDDFLDGYTLDARTAVVALTHDPKIDDLAMLAALDSEAFYIGALGSRRTTAKRAERLAEHFGLSDESLKRINGPIGIDLNSRRPQEIALAVMTDITAKRNQVEITTHRL